MYLILFLVGILQSRVYKVDWHITQVVGGSKSWYNQIPYQQGGQTPNWKISISQKFSHRSESSESHIKLLSLGVWQWEEETPENLALKASRVWLQEFHRIEGNINTTLGGCSQGPVSTRTQWRKQWSLKNLGQTYLLVLEVLLQTRKLWLAAETGILVAVVCWCIHSHERSWRLAFSCQDLAPPKSLCWRRLLRVPWTAKRSSLLILKEISPEYSLEGLMLKLKLQYFGQLMQRTDSFEELSHWKDPGAGKDWRQEEKGTTGHEMVGWHHRLDGHEFEQAPGDGEGQGSLECCSPWGHKEPHMTERLNWTEQPEGSSAGTP